MTYWRALEERSRILWQTLFRQSTLIEQSVPVYINTRSAPKGAEGEGQAALQPPAPEESAWTAGAEAEALRQPPAQENGRVRRRGKRHWKMWRNGRCRIFCGQERNVWRVRLATGSREEEMHSPRLLVTVQRSC